MTSHVALKSPQKIKPHTKRIIQKIIFTLIITSIERIIQRTIARKKKRPTPTWRIALSPHVFLNSEADSLMASLGHISPKIIKGKAKNVNTFHTQPIKLMMKLPMKESSPKYLWRALRRVVTSALILDQIKICFQFCNASRIPSQKAFSSPRILLCTEVIMAVLKKKVMKEKIK